MVKKTEQQSVETTQKSVQVLSQSMASLPNTSPEQLLEKTRNLEKEDTNATNHMPSIIENSRLANQTSGLKKSQSLGSIFDRYNDDDSHNPCSDFVNPEGICYPDDLAHREIEGFENADSSLFCESFFGDTENHTNDITQMIVKSCSVPNFDASSPISGGGSPRNDFLAPSRSCEDLQFLDPGDIHPSRDGFMHEAEKIDRETCSVDGNDSHLRNWSTPVEDYVNPRETQQGESAFKISRIEEWVSDLQLCSPPDETTEANESAAGNEVKSDSSIVTGRIDSKATSGMEAAKRYISSMTAAATIAQLANHGLVVIPFLSAFVSLKVLNLSANSIGKITAGALPRGLHSLNLSKNNIATIEGLRELTRLRVLDLRYNRICRIGHGLASCSSLKELYLAGNKIGEVEGLHRLLKLCVLDLRFNKISTIKSLGQLAANYNSLQAISLEGNPAQKNVGDEQLKKQLQGLLPHLVYYNRQATKGSAMKDGSDRFVRLGTSSHQFEHGGRLDHKGTRKTAHSHRGQGVVTPRQSKFRQRHVSALPPNRSKVNSGTRYDHRVDVSSSSKQFECKSDSVMRRSRSEGTLADL